MGEEISPGCWAWLVVVATIGVLLWPLIMLLMVVVVVGEQAMPLEEEVVVTTGLSTPGGLLSIEIETFIDEPGKEEWRPPSWPEPWQAKLT